MKNSIRMGILFSFLLSAFSVEVLAAAQKKKPVLKNFSAGTYSLSDGSEDLCGDGDFQLIEGGDNLSLGPYHGFFLKQKKETMKGDAPGDEGCSYEVDFAKSEKGKTTVLKFSEVRACKGKKMHTLIKEAYVNSDRIDLNFTQTGEDAQTYFCKWEKDE